MKNKTAKKGPAAPAHRGAPAASRLAVLLLGQSRGYFLENLSLLVGSGMGISDALAGTRADVTSRPMLRVIDRIIADTDAGMPLWSALESSGLFPSHAISLMRIGEETGRLVENLKVIGLEQEKDRLFKSKIKSAMVYPLFVLSLTLVIGTAIAWFILPKLATVFGQMRLDLPWVTKALLSSGVFLNQHGAIVVPSALVLMGLLVYVFFFLAKTKFLGQKFLFSLPGIKKLIMEIELSRFGFLLGTMLEAGLPITQALSSLVDATPFPDYRDLYRHLEGRISDGDSFEKAFGSYKGMKRLVPVPVQQLVVSGEKSGSLAATLLKFGAAYEAKTDITTKNLSVILEPIMLVIVWVGVVSVALAVILPIYSLIGGLNR
jgi:type II secretory pathway component PulF